MQKIKLSECFEGPWEEKIHDIVDEPKTFVHFKAGYEICHMRFSKHFSQLRRIETISLNFCEPKNIIFDIDSIVYKYSCPRPPVTYFITRNLNDLEWILGCTFLEILSIKRISRDERND